MSGSDTMRTAIYDLPHIYDIAFGYRDAAQEVEVMLGWCARVDSAPRPRRVLELASGPGSHAIAFARLGLEVVAIDLSAAMCAYAREQAEQAGLLLDVRCADMVDFALERPCQLAVSMLDSTSHILELDELLRHLEAVRAALEPGGLYVMEMAHPGDFMTNRPRTVTRWVQRSGSTEVRIAWGADDDPFDPTTQQGVATVLMRVTDPGGIHTFLDRVPYRRWTATEVEAAARLSRMEVAGWFGALDPAVPFGAEAGAWRMIPVLQRPLEDGGFTDGRR